MTALHPPAAIRAARLMDGNLAAAWGARLARAEVLPMYPITPAYPAMEHLTGFVERGELKARFIRVESDHSAMAACVGAALTGARTFTVTSSQGLAYMSEVLHQASGLRLPIVMAVVNRALHAPHSRWPDHGDAISQESSGWLQFFCETVQEVLDTTIQAFRIAQDERVQLPVMVNYEGYILSHAREPVHVPDQAEVDAFLPLIRRRHLDVDNPLAINAASNTEVYWGYKYNQHRAMGAAREVIREVDADFRRRFGREWGGLAEAYRTEGARTLVVTMGSMAASARVAVDRLRDAGRPAGLLKVRAFRPFPADELVAAAAGADLVVVIDRNIVYGAGGAVAREVKGALWGAGLRPRIAGWIAGLGGQDVGVEGIERMVRASEAKDAAALREPLWYGLDEGGEGQ